MLINCSVYKEGSKIASIEKDQISHFLRQDKTFVWLGLCNPLQEELLEYQKIFNLHDLYVEDVLHANQRPKVEEYKEALFIVMKTHDLINSEWINGEVFIFVGSNYVISVRVNSPIGFSQVRSRCESEPHLLKNGPGYVLYALIDAVVDRYFPTLAEMEETLDRIESRMFIKKEEKQVKNKWMKKFFKSKILFNDDEEEENHITEDLYNLKQKILLMKHSTGPLMEAIGKLYGGRVPQLCIGLNDYYGDVYDHLHRIFQTIDSLKDTVLTAIQVNLSIIALVETAVHKKLASWAAILAVPTMIAGIYGMNFQHMPELQWKHGYYVIIGLMVIVDIFLYIRFKLSGWL